MSDGAVVFDLDDTLYPYRAFVGSGFRAVARATERFYGVDARRALGALRQARVRGHRGCELQELCRTHRLPASALAELHAVMVQHQPTLRLPGASRAVLRALRPRWRLGVLTNGSPLVQAAKVAALGVTHLVDEVVFACAHGDGSGKPAPEGFAEVLSRLDVEPDRAVFVGNDPVTDIGGARAAGLHTIHVRRASAGHVRVRCSASVRTLLDVPAAAAQLLGEVEPAHVG
jgi:putative hydrolase of the HAD superfamily